MRAFKKSVIAVFAVAVLCGFFYFLFLPWYFSIKEPRFAVPVDRRGEVSSVESLVIRNDFYGEGFFGSRRKGGRLHKGLDLSAPTGSAVYASKSGWARFLRYPKGYGNLVIINHAGGWQTRYGHLENTVVRKSRWVWQGETIGAVGKTGNARAAGIEPHLHFEIRYKGEALDPAGFLVKKDGH